MESSSVQRDFKAKFLHLGLLSKGVLTFRSRSAMSNPNGLLSQNVSHYLSQGRRVNDILTRAAHWMAYFDL